MGTAAGLLVDVPWSCRLVLGGYCGAAVWPNSHARLLPLCNIISDKSKITQPLHHSPSLLQLLVLPASSRHPVSSILQLLTIVTDLAHQHHPRRCLLRKSSKNAVFFLCINSCVWVVYVGKWVCSQRKDPLSEDGQKLKTMILGLKQPFSARILTFFRQIRLKNHYLGKRSKMHWKRYF